MSAPITLFTGHTIPSLLDIAAIGPIDRQVVDTPLAPITRRLTLSIHLQGATRLEYMAIEQQLRHETPQDLLKWEIALQQLKEDRSRLIDTWGEALEGRQPVTYPIREG